MARQQGRVNEMFGNQPRFLAVMLAVAVALGGTLPVSAQDEEKPVHFLTSPEKVRFNAEDRKAASAFLATRRDDLKPAPRDLAIQVRVARRWTSACEQRSLAVPKKLERQLSEIPDGFVRRIFDRALVLIDADAGQVVDLVDLDE
jgi:hypothetical protein